MLLVCVGLIILGDYPTLYLLCVISKNGYHGACFDQRQCLVGASPNPE